MHVYLNVLLCFSLLVRKLQLPHNLTPHTVHRRLEESSGKEPQAAQELQSLLAIGRVLSFLLDPPMMQHT